MRSFAAVSSLVVVAFYLIAQMVGAGQLIQLLFGLDYAYAVLIVGVLMILYVTFGGMIATTWVQIIKADPAASWRVLHGVRWRWRISASTSNAMFDGGRPRPTPRRPPS